MTFLFFDIECANSYEKHSQYVRLDIVLQQTILRS